MNKLLTAAFISLFSFSALAQSYDYTCYSYFWNGHTHEKGTMTLTIDGNAAIANMVEAPWDRKIGGTRNPNYESKGSINYLKFGNNLILEEALQNGGKQLRDGKLGGFARVEGQAEGGFYQYKFVCKR